MDVCQLTNSVAHDDLSVVRRSANYSKNLWGYDFLQSLKHKCILEDRHVKLAEKLKCQLKSLITQPTSNPLVKLEFIDAVCRLGLKYQFQSEIKEAIDNIKNQNNDSWWVGDLHATSLRFRVLRENRMFVPQDVFEGFFTNEPKSNLKFKTTWCEDIKGLLSLYEASFLSWDDEGIIDEAGSLATRQLKSLVEKITSPTMATKVKHALNMPLQWRVVRYEARWYIDVYATEEDMNPILLKFAKLDFNIVQSGYHKEIGRLSRWWVSTGLDKLPFARDGLTQAYMFGMIMVPEPQYSVAREMITKVGVLLTTMDDVYDVYGTTEELELITNMVESWDIARVDELSRNIKMPLVALFNATNDIGYWTLKERGINGIPYMAKLWTDLLKAFKKEAEWFHEGYKPSFDEYIENGRITIGFPFCLGFGFLLTIDDPTPEKFNFVYQDPPLVKAACIICRILNDKATSINEMKRGEILNSMRCYMDEKSVSENVAFEDMDGMIRMWWKRLNKYLFESSPLSDTFMNFVRSVVQGCHFFYQYGDGYGDAENQSKEYGMSVLINFISDDDDKEDYEF